MVHAHMPSPARVGRGGDPDPYPNYAWLRKEAPVSALYSPDGDGRSWLVTSYEFARACLEDSRLSNDDREAAGDSERVSEELWSTARGLLNLDGPEHMRLRKVVSGAFSPRTSAQFRPMMERVCQEAIDSFASRGSADLAAEYALRVPVAIIHEVLGVPESVRKDPARCFDLFYRTGLARTTDPTCFEELVEYADELADYKRSHPGDDIGTLLLRSVDSGQLQGQRELRSMILSVLGAGHVTTVQSVGCAVLRLLENPDQLASIFAGSPSWAQSVNEMLRYDSPIQATVNRYATEDMRIGEVDVAKGDVVLISIAAANRDPERFEDPERFDVTRPSRSNLAFGHGTHLCLGAHLARIEGEVALEMLFRQLKDLRLAIDPAEVVWSYGPMLRGPRELPVTFSR